jgi:hypothetical protein
MNHSAILMTERACRGKCKFLSILCLADLRHSCFRNYKKAFIRFSGNKFLIQNASQIYAAFLPTQDTSLNAKSITLLLAVIL